MVRKNGIYRIGYHDLVKMGVDPSQINTANIRVFGTGAVWSLNPMLQARMDDLREISILVQDGGDGNLIHRIIFCFIGGRPRQLGA